MEYICQICKKNFIRSNSNKENPHKYCSMICRNIAYKGKHHSPKTETKKGQHLSLETEIKKGQRLSIRTEFKKGQNIGEKNYKWSGGNTSELMKRINDKEWRKISKEILKRDKWTCQKCSLKNLNNKEQNKLKIIAHHVIPWKLSKKNYTIMCISLCQRCHMIEENKINKQKMLEEDFSASDSKLLKHMDVLLKIQTEGKIKPITLELAPENSCNLNCTFCSLKNRDKTLRIPFNELKKTIDCFIDLGIKSIELTGGGDICLYPWINELIDYIHKKKITIGLITNGIALKNIKQKNINRIQWIRISLNSLDYVKDISIPKIKGTLGFSYVWNEKSTKEKLEKIEEYKNKYNAAFVRLVPNCLSEKEIQKSREILPSLISEYDKWFFQSKEYNKPDVCWWGYIKPFLYADKYIYMCSANPLINRDFSHKHKICHMSKVKEAWKNPKPFLTDVCISCCFFKTQNDIIKTMLLQTEHKNFI